VDLEARKIAWRYRHPERRFPFYSSCALGDGKVVLGGRDRIVHALDAATGREVWSFATRARVDSSPAIAGGRAFVGSGDGRLLALDLKTGALVESFEAARASRPRPRSRRDAWWSELWTASSTASGGVPDTPRRIDRASTPGRTLSHNSRIGAFPVRRSSVDQRARLVCVVTAALSAVAIASPAPAADWPGWRGPNRDAVSQEKGLLQQWGPEGPPLAWKSAGIGSGFAGSPLRETASTRWGTRTARSTSSG